MIQVASGRWGDGEMGREGDREMKRNSSELGVRPDRIGAGSSES